MTLAENHDEVQVDKIFGTTWKMIESMINDIVIFMVFFAIGLIIFASIGTLLFNSVSNYDSFYLSLKNLISTAMGNLNYLILANNDKSEYLGTIYLTIVIIVNNILILNLLIAILSSTYFLLEKK